MKIILMGISARAKACLRKAGYEEIEEILDLSKEELMEIKNLNESCADEILRAIEEYLENPAAELTQENTVGENDTSYSSGVIDAGIGEQEIKDSEIEFDDSVNEWNLSTLLKLTQIKGDDEQGIEDNPEEYMEKKPDVSYMSLSRIIEEADFEFPIDVQGLGWEDERHMQIETIRDGYVYGTLFEGSKEINTERLILKDKNKYTFFRR